MSTKKKRGVRASRIKLHEALAKSDIVPKTQIALANAISDREGLDAAPRDLVNKLFRELPVDPQTIERAARALGVNAKSLYQEGPDNAVLPETDEAIKPEKKPSPKRILAIALLPVLFFVGLVAFNTPDSWFSAKQCTGLTNSKVNTPSDKLGVVIGRFSGDPNNEIQIMLADVFMKNEKLSEDIEVFTSCNQINMGANASYSQGLLEQRKKAQADLKAVDAHIFIWGERSQNQINIRYTSLAANNTEAAIDTDQRAIQTNEIYFSIPVRLTASRDVPVEVTKIPLDFMGVKTEARKKTLSKLKSKFESTGDWIRDTVISDRNLLKTISPKTDPVLYALTGNQLCYRYRMLGDYEYNQEVYVEAEKACREVLENLPEDKFPSMRAVIQINLATVLVRQHMFARTLPERFKILDAARKMFESVEDEIKSGNAITSYAAFNKNLSLTYLYLGGITGGEDSLAYLTEASRRSNLGLEDTDKVMQPKDYAKTKQNLCLIGHRLANLTKEKEYALQAISDCKEAISGLSQHSDPQAWGMAQNNLAISYALFAGLSKDEQSLEKAITEFSKAQTNFTKERFPVNWAEVEINKAELNCRLAILKQDAAYFDKTNKHSMLALPVLVEHNVATHIDYITRLLDTVKSCDISNISSCKCSS